MPRSILYAIAFCVTGSSAFAAINVNSTPLTLSAPVGADVLIDFDNEIPADFTLTGGLIQNAGNSLGALPAGDSSNYLTVNPGGLATLMSATGYTSVSLYWGSIDAYNTIDLLDISGNTIQSYSGDQIFLPANGDQSSGSTNRQVTFDVTGDTSPIYGLAFASSQPAFEIDNVAFSGPVGGVPEPTSWAMMIGGLGLVGSHLRRGKRSDMIAVPA
jgi:hypothetical protein